LARGWQVPAKQLPAGVYAMPRSHHARYDALNRLIKAQTSNTSSTTWGQMFTYDGFGNLYQKTQTVGSAPTMTATVNAATNQLSLGSYDANGNLYSIPGANGGSPTYYAIDVENRMVSVNTTGSPSGVATYWYGYDPGNRRVWKGTYSSNGTLTAQEAYFYSPTGQKLGTYSLVLNNYPPSNDVAVATDIQVFFGAKRVGHSEPGNPTIIGGVIQDRVGSLGSYYPYGEDKGTPLPNDQWKFATYTRDSASGLDYAMNRYYSSSWGSFGSADPSREGSIASLPASWNRYSYASSDPVNAADPTGLWTCYFVDGQLDSCDDSQDLDPAAQGSTQQSQAATLGEQLARAKLLGVFDLALQALKKSGCLQLFENNGVPLKDPLTGKTLDPVAVLTGLYRAGEMGVNTGWGSVSFGIIGTDATTTADYSDLGLNSSGPYYSTTSVTFNVGACYCTSLGT
jgi:RHS repeat-associated protein